jgi:hypothetical protein
MQNEECATTRRIAIRKSVRPQLAEKIPGMVEEAISWLQTKYATVDFSAVEFIISGNAKRSRYWRNAQPDSKYVAPNAFIGTREYLGLYNMKSLNIKKTWLFVGREIQTMCALIHELTHHAQYELEMPKGELETTRNELEYLKEFYPQYHAKMVKA